MALGKKCNSLKLKRSNSIAGHEGYELGLVNYTRGLGRKRIVISSNGDALFPFDSSLETPLKKRCSERMAVVSERSPLEALPQDILIRILCCVDHEDLKQLVHVSKSISEATLIAKQCHFAYSTPRKTRALRSAIDFHDCGSEVNQVETPIAPKQTRLPRSRLSRKKLESISVALFASADDEDHWPRKNLFAESQEAC